MAGLILWCHKENHLEFIVNTNYLCSCISLKSMIDPVKGKQEALFWCSIQKQAILEYSLAPYFKMGYGEYRGI